MNADKSPWPNVVLASVVAVVIGVLLVLKVEVTTIVTAFSVVGTVVGVAIFRDVQQVKQQTNGQLSKAQDQVADGVVKHAELTRELVDYLKTQVAASPKVEE
jgi:multisubunit Na+/H+ antiporter MnhC subunit